jgi:hypothetical protein
MPVKDEVKSYVIDRWEPQLVKAAVAVGVAGIAAQKLGVKLLKAVSR